MTPHVCLCVHSCRGARLKKKYFHRECVCEHPKGGIAQCPSKTGWSCTELRRDPSRFWEIWGVCGSKPLNVLTKAGLRTQSEMLAFVAPIYISWRGYPSPKERIWWSKPEIHSASEWLCEPAAGEELQAENAKPREELKNFAFSYATIKCKMGQMLSFTGLTSFIFEYNRQNHRQCRNNLPKSHSAGSSYWFLLMKLRVGLK